MNNQIIKLHLYINSTKALGPFKRFALWVQGCNRNCKGCMTPESRDINNGFSRDIYEIAEAIINTPDIEGITISGGEPFLQAEELVNLIEIVKEKRDLGIIIYTGYKYDELKKLSTSKKLLSYCDLLIDGEYIEELDDGLSLRGSSNQKIIQLSCRYSSVIDDYYNDKGRKVEIRVDSEDVTIIGVPSKDVLKMFKKNKI